MLSVIVPVYNVESYLSICVESILNQTYTNFELLLINDGSTDLSGNICDRYAALDSRIKVFHQKNKGVSVARNVGIKHAQGEFVCFIDSDDWVSESYLSDFMIDNYRDYDLIFMNMNDFSGKEIFALKNSVVFYENNDISKFILEFDLLSYGCPYLKLFKKDILLNECIFFPEGIQFGEDTLFFFKYLFHVSSVCFVNKKGYFYRDTGLQSLSKKIHDPKKILFFLEKEKKDLIGLCLKFNVVSSKYYQKYHFLLIKRIILNFLNCNFFRYNYYERKSIWMESKRVLKLRDCKTKINKTFFVELILLLIPFFLLDLISKIILYKRV